MTTTEALNKIAWKYGHVGWETLVYSESSNTIQTQAAKEAMELYAAQFISYANAIIIPADDILPDTYKDELDAWFTLIEKVQDENNS